MKVWTCIETDNSNQDHMIVEDSVHATEETARAYACLSALEHIRNAEGYYPEADVREICRLIFVGERVEAIGQIEAITSLHFEIRDRKVRQPESPLPDRAGAEELLASLNDDVEV